MIKLKELVGKIFNKTLGIILFCLFLGSLFLYWGWYVKQYHKAVAVYYVHQGDKAYRNEHLQKAIYYYNKGLDFYPEHYTAQYNLGNIYVAYEDYFSAAESYRKAIEYNPKCTLARMNLGIISTEKLGDFDEAINQYQEIINSKKTLWAIPFIFNNKKSEKINRGLAYYNMGVAYREKSIYQSNDFRKSNENLLKAIEAYKKAEKILKNDYDLNYNLAMAYHLSGNYNDAGKSYCKAIKIEPMFYETHYNFAILLRHLKLYKEAYNEMEKAAVLISHRNINTNISSYIFNILNDVSKTLIENNEYKYLVEKIDNNQNNSQLIYVNGKILATDAFDRAMLKNFSTCENKFFEQEKYY